VRKTFYENARKRIARMMRATTESKKKGDANVQRNVAAGLIVTQA
jgi:hypothetical protein